MHISESEREQTGANATREANADPQTKKRKHSMAAPAVERLEDLFEVLHTMGYGASGLYVCVAFPFKRQLFGHSGA